MEIGIEGSWTEDGARDAGALDEYPDLVCSFEVADIDFAAGGVEDGWESWVY